MADRVEQGGFASAEFVRSSWKCVDQHTREGLVTVIERISLQEEMSKAPAATARTTTYT